MPRVGLVTVLVSALAVSSSTAATPPHASAPRVTVLLDATTLWADPGGAGRIDDFQRESLLYALKGLLARLTPSSTRVVAFNQEKALVLYRRDSFEPALLRELSAELADLKLSEIDVHTLGERDPGARLLERLVEDELRSSEPADAVIFLGPAERFLGHARPQVAKTGAAPLFFDLQLVAAQVVTETSAGNPNLRYSADKGDFTGRRDGISATRVIHSSASSFDTVATVVRELGGKLLQIYTPGDFDKSVDRIIRDLARRRR